MTHRTYFLLIATTLCGIAAGATLTPLVVQAEEPTTEPASDAQTRIVTDQDAGVVRIEIGGETVATFDAGGLRVERDIEFRGSFIDINDAK